MKKHMKKIVSLALAVIMAFAMSATAFAATITNTSKSHTYEVYQIFTGDLNGKTLSNVKWGANGTGTVGAKVEDTILKELSELDANASDTEKLAVIQKYVNLTSDPFGVIEGAGALEDVPNGYYLIKDLDGSQEGNDDAYTTYLTKIVGDLTIEPKSSKPTVDKEVKDEEEDAETGSDNGWGETADHEINESFQFKLTATLPADSDFAAYETYKLVFHDTMSKGLTFESIVSVTVNGTSITEYILSANAVNGAKGPLDWTLTIEDLKEFDADLTDGAVVEVIYNAHLNEEAAIGNVPNNKNDVYLEYSNNPNVGGEGETGETEKDTVWVFTYDMENTKVDGSNDNEPLAGAGFKLYDETGENEIGLIFDEELDAYRPIKDGETAEEMFSADGTGKFNIVGLDAGTYVLKETTTPPGYNTCDPITIVISADHEETQGGASATTDIEMTQDGTVTDSNTIVNNKGTELPETGGIGTTIFYVIGASLMLIAAVLLITRKKMQGHNN